MCRLLEPVTTKQMGQCFQTCCKTSRKGRGTALLTSGSPSKSSEIPNEACFGAGCYWGTEKYFVKSFPGNPIRNGKVGFMGPDDAKKNPTYEDVCSGVTGHVEVFKFEFDGTAQTYEALVRYFFQFHDPTTENRQGNDRGTQYASVIYTFGSEQETIAKRVRESLQRYVDEKRIRCFKEDRVTTDVRPATIFYEAKEEHQQYLERNPKGYCNHRIRFDTWPQEQQ